MKKSNLKLQIHRETVRNLDSNRELDKVRGGIVSTDVTDECMATIQRRPSLHY